jgi:phage terminase large subunit-like protein
MRLCFPGVQYEEHRLDGYFSFENGSQFWIGGLDDKERVEKILGQEYATIFLNECSQIPYASVLIARTRLAQNIEGLNLRMYYDLNPPGKLHWSNWEFGQKKSPLSKQPLPDPENYARMQINPEHNRKYLAPEYIKMLDNMPEKQRRRFSLGEYIEEVDGALWTYDRLDAVRIEREEMPPMQRIVVSVDPSGAAGNEDTRSDEIGINVSGKDYAGRAYVLEDLTCKLGPAGWARVAVNAFDRWMADCIIAERNFGGAMVESTIRNVRSTLPVKLISASRGKAVRAEPISALYDERVDMVRHVGRFPDLEDQLCSFSGAGYFGEKSPDRADAAIWALSELMLGSGKAQLFFG